MPTILARASLYCLLILGGCLLGRASPLRADDSEPLLQLEGRGPLSYVTSLAFSPDGRTLYAGGWDKVVRVWRIDERTGNFVLDERAALRVPIGPGLDGAINAIALSPDGRWLAVGGRGTFRGASGFRQRGKLVPSGAMLPEMRADQGTIYVFDVATRQAQPIRGHWGEILAMEFAPSTPERPLLISVGRDWDEGQFSATLRLWDVQQQQYLGGKSLDVPDQRPQLAAWRQGEALRVGLAWGDGQLRLWDVQTDRLAAADAGGRFNNTIAHLSQQYLITGNADRSGGHLQRWYYEPQRGLQQDHRWRSRLNAGQGQIAVPRTLAMASAGGNGRLDQLVVVALELENDQPRQYVLHLLDAGTGTLAARLPLWNTQQQLHAPIVATAPEGGHVAVAGSGDKSILVYSLNDLQQRRQRAVPQRLESVGAPVRAVAFARTGDRLGLKLDEQERADRQLRPGDRIFDIQGGLITFESGSGWQLDGAEARWSPRRVGNSVLLSPPNADYEPVQLDDGAELTSQAFSSASDPAALAVATYTAATGETSLLLYEATTGQLLRRCTAHTLPIRSLAFTRDGRLLASAADDYLVCLWSLTDLQETLGQHGRPPQIPLRVSNGRLAVLQDVPAHRLQRGDILVGALEAAPWENEVQMFDAFWNAQPGSQLSVEVQRSGQRLAIRLPVEQGADERKPLFSLFVTQQERNAGAQWIAWSPSGPYETSSAEAERYIGWHFNTGDPTAPTSFAHAGQYRQQFYRPGLLSLLVEQGKFPEELPPPPPLERPTMKLSFPALVQQEPEAAGEVLVREAQGHVQFQALGLQSQAVSQLELELNQNREGQWVSLGEFELEADQDWQAQLPADIWQRGRHELRAILTTNEETPQQFRQLLQFRYQPVPPAIEIVAEDQVVTRSQYTFEAKVTPASPDQPLDIEIVHTRGDRAERLEGASGQVAKTVVLEPGLNEIELIARHADALEGFEEYETSRKRVRILYDSSGTPPPLITIGHITPVDGQGQSEPPLVPHSGAVNLQLPAIHISGTIESPEPLEQATVSVGGQAAALELKAEGAPTRSAFRTTRPLRLNAGAQTILLTASAADKQGEAVLEVVFQPPLPQPAILAPRDGLTVIAGRSHARIGLVAELSLPPADHPFRAEIRVNGQARLQPEIQRLDAPGRARIEADVPLEGGENRIELVISNQWGSEPQIASTVVNYRRPPRVSQMETSEVGEEPFVGVRAVVESPLPLTRIEVNGRRLAADVVGPAGPGQYRIDVPDIPLTEGSNDIYLFAWNAEGVCLQPGVVRNLMFMHAPPPLPGAQLLDPADAANWSEPEYPVRFRITSASRLRRAELLRNDEVVYRVQTDQLKAPEQRGQFVVEETVKVPLQPGGNRLQLVAINDGGEETAEVMMTYVEPPVRIVIDYLTPIDQDEPKHRPDKLGHQILFADSASEGRMMLHGRVIWNNPNEDLRKKWSRVQVWVNGFQQMPKMLAPPTDNARQRTFQVPLVLNQDQRNVVELRLPDLSEELSSHLNFEIDCAQPETEQRLHLLIVGIGVSDAQQLQRQALEALKASSETTRHHQFQTSAFARGFVYGPIVGATVSRAMIFDGLSRIRSSIQRLASQDPGNDVVMIYYQGGEMVDQQGRFFLTTVEPGDASPNLPFLESTSLDSVKLNQFIDNTPGAHVLLLEVARISGEVTGDERPGSAAGLEAPSAAVLRYAWTEPTKVPKEAHLLVAMRGALQVPQRVSLDLLGQRLAENLQSLPEALQEALRYERYVPAPVANLTLAE